MMPTGKIITCIVAALLFAPVTLASAISLDPQVAKIQVTEEIIVQGKPNISRRVKRGFAAFKARDFAAAEKYFQRARKQYELEAGNTFFFMQDLWNISNVTGARAESTILDVEVRKAIAIINFMEGMSQLAQGHEGSALYSFKRAIKVNPSHFDAHAEVALIQIKHGKAAKAKKHFKKLVRMFNKCRDVETCQGVKERLVQVEQVYGRAVTSG